jgi:hypothetical protein
MCHDGCPFGNTICGTTFRAQDEIESNHEMQSGLVAPTTQAMFVPSLKQSAESLDRAIEWLLQIETRESHNVLEPETALRE